MNRIQPPSDAQDRPIKIYWSSRSPFVRNVMIAIHELELADQVETIPVVVNAINQVPELEERNALAQIPTLILPDGTAIYDSRVIVDYLDAEFGSHSLLPADYPRRLDVLRRAARAQGLTEKAMRWLLERFRPAEMQSAPLMSALARTVNLTLDEIEADAATWTGLPVDAGHICLAAILGYLDFRFAAIDWRNGRPAVAAWHQGFAQRPSYVNTAFADSLDRAPDPVKV